MPEKGNKPEQTPPAFHPADVYLPLWHIHLEGDWSRHEKYRILNIFQRLSVLSGGISIPQLFNHQSTILNHSGRPGRVGRTRGGDIFLDDDWTDWTFAHELGHRWNNAWNRRPEKRLRKVVGAGKLEWLKKCLRHVEKWLEKALRRLGFKSRLDWRGLWYHPGEAPPPCGVDRNFNASEDLAESFAAIIFQEDVRRRARRAIERIGVIGKRWDWPSLFQHFLLTPRGQFVMALLRKLPAEKEGSQEPE